MALERDPRPKDLCKLCCPCPSRTAFANFARALLPRCVTSRVEDMDGSMKSDLSLLATEIIVHLNAYVNVTQGLLLCEVQEACKTKQSPNGRGADIFFGSLRVCTGGQALRSRSASVWEAPLSPKPKWEVLVLRCRRKMGTRASSINSWKGSLAPPDLPKGSRVGV